MTAVEALPVPADLLTDVAKSKDEQASQVTTEFDEAVDRLRSQILNWADIEAGDFGTDWLVDDIWPSGGMVHFHAKPGVGKSLMLLSIAADLATGCEPFQSGKREPVDVLYVDYEMTKGDLKNRLENMGYNFAELKRLHYLQQPDIPPLDTEEGGAQLVGLAERIGAQAVVIDTMSACVEGEENSADTYKAFDAFVSAPLKGRGVAVARLDHEGHSEKRSRGSSGKATAPDVIWGLAKTDSGLELKRTKCRVDSDVDKIALHQESGPLKFRRSPWSYPEGTKKKAEELDNANVPLDASSKVAREMLNAAGLTPGKNTVLCAALRSRKQPSPDRPPAFTEVF